MRSGVDLVGSCMRRWAGRERARGVDRDDGGCDGGLRREGGRVRGGFGGDAGIPGMGCAGDGSLGLTARYCTRLQVLCLWPSAPCSEASSFH